MQQFFVKLRSYEVEDEKAQTYICNRKHLKKAGEHTNNTEDNMPAMLLIPSDPYPVVTPGPASDTADTPGTATPPPNQPPESPATTRDTPNTPIAAQHRTKSGRTVKPPSYLKDFHKK